MKAIRIEEAIIIEEGPELVFVLRFPFVLLSGYIKRNLKKMCGRGWLTLNIVSSKQFAEIKHQEGIEEGLEKAARVLLSNTGKWLKLQAVGLRPSAFLMPSPL